MSDSTDPMTRWRFFMNFLGRSGQQTEKHAEKSHLRILMVASIVVLAILILGGIPAAIHYHEYAAVVVLVFLAIVIVGAFLYWMLFEGYYTTYLEEHRKRIAAEQQAATLIVTDTRRLHFSRMIQDGKKRLAVCDALPTGDAMKALDTMSDLQRWHRETLQTIKESYPSCWDHFADLGPLEIARADFGKEQAEMLLQRLKDIELQK